MEAGPSENVRALAAANEFFNANIPRVLAGEEVEIPEFWSEDVELVNFEPSPFPGTYHGHEGLLQWTRDLFEEFRDGYIEAVELEESGDLIAVHLRLTATGRASGIEGSLDWGGLFEIRDGRCVRVIGLPTYEGALERLRGASDD
jgi:ketosteroid isomerase-like protein